MFNGKETDHEKESEYMNFKKICVEHLFKNGKALSPSARHVYHVLVGEAYNCSYAVMSLYTIQEVTGYSRPTVISCIKKLEETNFLKKLKRPSKNGLENVYELDPEKIYIVQKTTGLAPWM